MNWRTAPYESEESRALRVGLSRIDRLLTQHPNWTREDVYRFIELREEGYPAWQAEVMAGLADPS